MKSILVLDNDPYDCTKCKLNAHTDYDFDVCWIDKRSQGDCPLKPMPEEKMVDAIPISFLKDKIALNESWGCYGYAKGLQSAIDEWEKQNESNISN